MTAAALDTASTVWRAGRPVDVRGTLRPLLRGRSDRAHRVLDGVFWRAALTPAGPATLALRQVGRDEVEATAWGPGAAWTVESVPDLLGARDSLDGFDPRHPVLTDVHRRHPGIRVPRTGLVLDSMIPAILEQKVTGTQAHQAWSFLLQRYGGAAPGPAPAGLRVPPPPAVLLTVPTWDWHRAGVDGRRQRAIRAAATVAARLEECCSLSPAQALARLRVVPGIGVWTAAETAQRALGDADAVSVGDFHIPGLVGHFLIGRRVDDDGMLALLAEYAPHRHRVVRLIELSGVGKPRYGPRFSPTDMRSF
ncbi:MAG TPA: DNA-3-methyladenine glycosylase 2 family protein [Mycobacteriales bacterium]|jgi:3-methyladenine DNA glycosylase/8-oxoguanine DNA glycosylase|nr:DNA-3-methyladenine glycosylase 2 family protein [Mycobacteriales bacterium]